MIRIRISDPRSLGSWQIKWPDESTLSLRSRRLEVVGERENGRARGRHAKGEAPSPLACLLLARPFFLVPTTSKRLLRRLIHSWQGFNGSFDLPSWSRSFQSNAPKLVRLSKTNVLTIETDYYRSFWKLVRQTVFQSSFLLFVTFDMVLGRHICWTPSCYFVIHELFFQVS